MSTTQADVNARLVHLVATHLDIDPKRLQPGTRLGEDLCVDSLGAVELTMAMEDEFDIALPDDVVADICTFGDVVAVVSRRLAAGA
ncbi:MAG TPA: acyl carrier protein [Acidimicrobiales bacterium]|nr:acyl carrier protein [Acidimicrobiales bacterium]